MILNLFSGPGGWEVGLRRLPWSGRVVGVEWEPSAHATARAAGHESVLADVAALEPLQFWESLDADPVWGVIASPPCQAWSAAGKRKGELDRALCHLLADRMASGDDSTNWTPWADERSPLVAQPVRWVRDLQPEWIALEEVPAVLPFWEHLGRIFEGWGYRVWTGVLCAANYGVPQKRFRAILIASRVRPVGPPVPTHSEVPSLLTPSWVTMAEALGWGDDLVGFPRRNDQADGGAYRARDLFPASGPAQTVTEKARSWQRFHGSVRPGEVPPVFVSGNQKNATRRSANEPAPTLLFGNRANDVRWLLGDAPVAMDRRTNSRGPDGEPYPTPVVGIDRPSPTITGAGCPAWVFERPATTVCGDPRLGSPGHRDRAGGEPQFGVASFRVSVVEAAVLQDFPADYPWQGSKTKRFGQVGNAIPPGLAAHVLSVPMGLRP